MPEAGLAGTVTFTLTVHVLLGASVPFENDSEVAPAVGANVGAPQPDFDELGGLATVMAAGDVGSGSVKFTPPIVSDVGFVIVNVRVEVPAATVELGVKALAIVREAGERTFAMRAEAEKSLL